MPRKPAPKWLHYLGTIATTAAATILGFPMAAAFSNSVLFATYFAAVAVSGWYGGFGPGAVATVLSYFAACVFFVKPERWFVVNSVSIGFFFVGLAISVFSESAKRAMRRSKSHADQVKSIAESITDGFVAIDSQWRFTYMNRAAEELNRRYRKNNPGNAEGDLFPLTLDIQAKAQLRQAATDRVTVEFENFHEPWRRWFEIKASPTDAGGLAIYFRDITERKLAEEALREADRRKDSFLAVLGHELRNPLAGIVNGVQLLNYASSVEPEMRDVLAIIERQATQMSRLIDDLLDVSRIARGKITLRSEAVDLTALARQTAEDHLSIVRQNGLKLDLETWSQPLWIDGDSVRLSQVLGNLLNNAMKFTDSGGRIVVHTRCDEHRKEAIIEVRDTGIGMAPETIDLLFEPFAQAEGSLGRSRGGLGLGLALVKGLVQLHHGTVAASSDGPGRGSTFAIRLPLRAAPAPRRPDVHNGTPTCDGYRVLIIDDNPDVSLPMSRLLEVNGHDTAVAADGPSGVELARHFNPDVVLCDIGLPGGMNGYGVAEALRADPTMKSVYLVAVTGFGQEEDRRRAAQAGFDRHMTKPVNQVDLLALLTGVASNRNETAQ